MVSVIKTLVATPATTRSLQPDIATRQRQSREVAMAPQSLSLASALAQKGPPFDADKVASLRAAIASGNYQINLGNIADGIIRFGLSGDA